MLKPFLIIFITCLGISMNILAQENQKVADAIETLRKAMVSAEKSALENIVSDKLSYGHSNGNVEDKKAFIEALTSGKSDFVSIDLSEQSIEVSGDVAIVRHILSAETNNNGQAGLVKLGILLIWQKQKGKWKLIARQAVKI
jgi:ketosteroid isomerase-like protein